MLHRLIRSRRLLATLLALALGLLQLQVAVAGCLVSETGGKPAMFNECCDPAFGNDMAAGEDASTMARVCHNQCVQASAPHDQGAHFLLVSTASQLPKFESPIAVMSQSDSRVALTTPAAGTALLYRLQRLLI